MTTKEYRNTEESRSSIWTVSNVDLFKFFVVYALIYGCGSAVLVWLNLKRSAAPHDVASDIITGVSLIGVGIAPTLALVLIETWRFAMIFSRGMALRLEEKEERLREEGRAQVRKELDRIKSEAYEAGVRDTLAKVTKNGNDSSTDESN
ncbi:MAG: hypothetical protein OXC83_04140 [Chloroflexi bacterium]|nr:hypothetical protein [Chloroflexota bacterium]